MESYGKIVGGRLQLSSDVNPCLFGARSEAVVVAGTKRVAFAPIPAFDQLTEYVYQTPPVDGKSGISVGVAVGKCAVDAIEPVREIGTRAEVVL